MTEEELHLERAFKEITALDGGKMRCDFANNDGKVSFYKSDGELDEDNTICFEVAGQDYYAASKEDFMGLCKEYDITFSLRKKAVSLKRK